MKKILWLIVIVLTIAGGVILIKKKKEELANLPTPQPPQIVVETAKPQPREVNQTITLVGRYYALTQAAIATKVAGRIEKIFVNEGQRVEAKEPLLKIDDSEIQAQIKAQEAVVRNLALQEKSQKALLEAAKIDEKNAYESLKRDRRLYKAGALAKEKYELKQALYAAKKAKRIAAQTALEAKRNELEAAKAALKAKKELLSYTHIQAPYGGTISTIFFKEGSFAPLGKPLLTLLGDRFVIDLPFEEGVDTTMRALVDGKPCRVRKILPKSLNSLKIARLECKNLTLPDNTQVKTTIVQKSAKNYALPIKALYEENDKKFVFVKKQDTFEPVRIDIAVLGEAYFIPTPIIKEPVAIGSNEKLAKLFLQKAHR